MAQSALPFIIDFFGNGAFVFLRARQSILKSIDFLDISNLTIFAVMPESSLPSESILLIRREYHSTSRRATGAGVPAPRPALGARVRNAA